MAAIVAAAALLCLISTAAVWATGRPVRYATGVPNEWRRLLVQRRSLMMLGMPRRKEPRMFTGYFYTCAQCGTTFSGRTKGRRHCSYACSNAARGRTTANELRHCPICGGPITTLLDEHPTLYARLKTCSRSCGQVLAEQSRTPKHPPLGERPCRRCGKAFVPPNRVNKGHYCSNACHLADLHGKPIDPSHP